MGTLLMALTLLAGGGTAPPSRTGTWTSGGASKEAGGGVLAVIDDAGGTRFQLQLSRGAPSYNLGFLAASLKIDGGRATYRSDDGACAIAFAFTRETVVLTQEGTDFDCGFGHGVYADGTYRRTSRKKPNLDLLPK